MTGPDRPGDGSPEDPEDPVEGSRGHRRGASGPRRPPPWWPEGEPWPPAPPAWQTTPRRFRRRFLLAAAMFLAALVGIGLAIAVIAGPGPHRPGGPSYRDTGPDRGPPPILAIGVGILAVGGIATALAYRRISRPVGDLLGAAEQVATGDYDVHLLPEGPRDLRMLTSTFNGMAARLADADEQRRRFLADVTHELRTPLAVLRSGIEAQIDGIHPRDDRHLASLLEEAERLGRLVDDLHTLALADAGRIVLHRERVSPVALVEEAVAGHSAVAERAGVALSTVADPALVDPATEIDVDPTRIRQVLDNLLSNAIRHSPEGGGVRVTVEPDDVPPPGVRVTVTDAGPGFAPGTADQVFDRFTRSADSRGSGLGLSIARDLVEAHGGTIEARNEPAGGATVTFTLPARPG
jgi:signal transduction histidine kinase